MYNKVDSNMDFAKRELNTLKFWKENDIFQKSIEHRCDCPVFTFYDGPPTANGKPHIGHIITRVVKDIIPRYKTMKGYKVLRKAGWDTHGLPVELEVEKQLGISGKPEIEKYGVEPFIKQCKTSVWKYEQQWREMSDRVGFWADMDKPYVTYDNSYIESVWWALKTIWDKDLLYKGHKIVPYCPRCGTALSSHEVSQGYKDVCEKSIYVKFKIKDKENQYFLAWTTTPWTLPSNVSLVVNPEQSYALVEYKNEKIIMAEALLSTVLGEEVKVLELVKGKQLEGMEYEPLFDFYLPEKKAYFVCCDDYVTLTDGTGIVHCAPAFGEDDARVGRKYDLPFVQHVDEQGLFVDITPWSGVFVKDADPTIIKDLEKEGKLFKIAEYEHSYPFCWRCDTPLLYYARDAWFIKMSELRQQLIKNNDTVNWLPDNIKTGRFGNFLENVIDWGLSRERYWGTPLPIWECSCGHRHAIGSIAELKEMGEKVPDDIELHRPYIDEVILNCPKCKGGKMRRTPEVIDCWFDSGSMPFAQWHYPFENADIFNENFPADFISEAIDQTRGWFYTLMAISTLLFDKAPFKNCIVLGHVQDKDGRKMSKHVGNVIDPWTVLDKQGADAVRWYFITNSAPWLPNRFYAEAVGESQRKFMGTFWNTYAFYVLYAEIDQFNPLDHKFNEKSASPMDKWILSKMNSLIQTVDNCLENYKLTEAGRALHDFVDNLSNWYVRRCRERFWGSEMDENKVNAFMTLYNCLLTVTKLAAPFVPFMTEEIYANLVKTVDKNAPASVHLCDFPVSNTEYIDLELEKNMELVLDIVVLGRAGRNTANIKNRQPIAKMFVKSSTLPDDYIDIIKDELNIKSVEFVDNVDNFTTYTFKPQLRTLGPKYGKLVPKIAAVLNSGDGNALMSQFNQGNVTFTVDETEVILSLEDVLYEVSQQEGYVTESDKNVTVVLETTLTAELIEEGFVREIISKLQTMRKEAGFEVLDRIKIYCKDNDKITDVINRNKSTILNDVLATELITNTLDGFTKPWNINGENVSLGVEKITQ